MVGARSKFAGAQTASWRLETPDIAAEIAALDELGKVDAPELKAALDTGTRLTAREAGARAGGSIGAAVKASGVQKSGSGVTVMQGRIRVAHPAAKVREFGRHFFYVSKNPGAVVGMGNNRGSAKRVKGSMKRRGRKVYRQGQAARPFLGVKNRDQAIGKVAPRVMELVQAAVRRMFERKFG